MTRFFGWAVQPWLSSFLLVVLVVSALSQSRNTGEICGTLQLGEQPCPMQPSL